MSRHTLTAHVLLLVTLPPVHAQATPPAHGDARRHASAEHGLAMRLPDGWQRAKSSKANILTAVGPAGDPQRIRLQVRRSQSLTLNAIFQKGFARSVSAGIKKSLKSYQFEGTGVMKRGQPTGIWLRGKVGTLYIKQFIFAGPRTGFITTVTYKQGTSRSNLRAIDEVIGSIEMTTPAGTPSATVKSNRVSTAHGLSMDLPRGWQLRTAIGGTIMLLRGPGTASLNVCVTDATSQQLNAKALRSKVGPVLRKAISKDCKIVRSRSMKAGRHKAVRLDYRFTKRGKNMRGFQLYIQTTKRSFVLTFTSSTADYMKQKALVDRALKSLHIS